MASFTGKLIAVTGAASGIGRATAKLLASRGALLSLSDINSRGLESIKTEIEQDSGKTNLAPGSITTSVVDVTSSDACNEWIQKTVEHFKAPIAGAANLAGVTGNPKLGRDTSDAEFEFVWNINVKGVLNSLRAELPHLQKGENGRGGGAIVNASSLSGLMGLPTYLPYVSSKHAVIGITRTAAKEEGRNGIRVNAIAPAMIDTPMLEEVAKAAGGSATADMFGAGPSPALARLGDADEVAELVAFLLSPQSSYISGTVITIDGGMGC